MPYADPEKARECYRNFKRRPEQKAMQKARVQSPEGRAKTRAWNRANPDKLRRYNRTKEGQKLGWTDALYDAVLAAQRGRCGICGGRPSSRLHRDHNHANTKPRGLLCIKCNSALGLMRDQTVLLRAAADYLERYE